MFTRRRILRLIHAAIVIIAAALLIWGAVTDSAIMDELAHIPAGYGYVSALDYRLNPEHPPLVKALAGFPLLGLRPSFPESRAAWQSDLNGQWAMGTAFLYESGNDADWIVRIARAGPIILTLLTIAALSLWARTFVGEGWALIPMALFALSPIVLAHGHYVTTDIGAAFGILIAAYAFLRFLRAHTQHNLFLAGIALGVAELAKFSAVLLIPYFLILALLKALLSEQKTAREYIVEMRRWLGRALLVIFAAYAFVVYPVYALFTLRYPPERQHSDTAHLLASFAGGPAREGTMCTPLRCVADLTIAATNHPFTRPLAEYSLGVLMVMERAKGGNTNYFLGSVSASGSPLYFPVVYALKETLPVLIFLLGACVIGLAAFVRRMPRLPDRQAGRIRELAESIRDDFDAWALGIFIALYWWWSITSNLNIGVRHIIPTLPFLYLLAARAWKWQLTRVLARAREHTASFTRAASATLQWTFVMFLGLWFMTEIAVTAPRFLSYVNELGGGTARGYRYVTDSNYDWGQDLLRLTSFVAAHPEIGTIAVDYFGGGNPKYSLGKKEVDWSSAKGNPSAQGIRWLAVSVNTLQSAIQPAAKGFTRKPEDEYRWLVPSRAEGLTQSRKPIPGMGNVPAPDYRAGTSIFVYKL